MLNNRRSNSVVAAALIVLEFFPLLPVKIHRVRVQRAEHPGDRSFGHLVEINLPSEMVLRDEDGIAKVVSDSRASGEITRALTRETLPGVRARKREWQYKRQDQQQVSLLDFHLKPLGELHESRKNERSGRLGSMRRRKIRSQFYMSKYWKTTANFGAIDCTGALLLLL